MPGPERRFISNVHRHIEPQWCLWKECMTGKLGGNGTPDYYYDAVGIATWIEYKFISKFPEVITLHDRKKRYGLSPHQRRWLNRAHRNGVRVAVALGSDEGALIFTDGAWEREIHAEEYRGCVTNASGVAHFAAGFNNYRVVVQYNEDARVQHEHTSSSLHHRK